MTAFAAAMPEENATAVPCSSAPRASSRAEVVGAASRAYSMEPPAWNAEAGTIGVFSGWSGPGARAAGADDDRLDGQRVGLGHTQTLAVGAARAGYGRAVNRIRVVVLLGGRSSEHSISCISGRSIVGGTRSGRGTTSRWSASGGTARGCANPDGGTGDPRRGRATAGDRRGRAGRRPVDVPRRRRRLPGPARPVGRGRHGAGAARDAGRALRGVRRARRRRWRWTRAS